MSNLDGVMTVGKLMARLSTFDPTLPVFIQQGGSDYDWIPALGAGEDDLDMADEEDEDDEPKPQRVVCIGYE